MSGVFISVVTSNSSSNMPTCCTSIMENVGFRCGNKIGKLIFLGNYSTVLSSNLELRNLLGHRVENMQICMQFRILKNILPLFSESSMRHLV